MAHSLIHAKSSARRYGGVPDDYIKLHAFLDSTRTLCGDPRHRVFLHNTFAVNYILPLIFGDFIVNSSGREVNVQNLGCDHLSEDYGGVCPTASDWIDSLELAPWMLNGAKGQKPPSYRRMTPIETVL